MEGQVSKWDWNARKKVVSGSRLEIWKRVDWCGWITQVVGEKGCVGVLVIDWWLGNLCKVHGFCDRLSICWGWWYQFLGEFILYRICTFWGVPLYVGKILCFTQKMLPGLQREKVAVLVGKYISRKGKGALGISNTRNGVGMGRRSFSKVEDILKSDYTYWVSTIDKIGHSQCSLPINEKMVKLQVGGRAM